MGDNHQIALRQHQGLICLGDTHHAIAAMGEVKPRDILVGWNLHAPR